jgi:uncharacterized protein DUF4112
MSGTLAPVCVGDGFALGRADIGNGLRVRGRSAFRRHGGRMPGSCVVGGTQRAWDATMLVRDRLRTQPRILDRRDERRARSLAEVESLAWLLDSSIPLPGIGRRLGIDALIGLIPGFGDVVGGVIGLYVVWRASRMGLPGIVVARMLVTTLVDMAIGVIPFLGDVFDFWFKSNARNLTIMRRHLQQPDRSTRDDWVAVLLPIGAVIAALALFGWLVASAIGAFFGLFS